MVLGTAYAALVTLRLAWHGETFTKFTAGPAGAEAPDTVESAAEDLDVLQHEVALLADEVSASLRALTERLDRLERTPQG